MIKKSLRAYITRLSFIDYSAFNTVIQGIFKTQESSFWKIKHISSNLTHGTTQMCNVIGAFCPKMRPLFSYGIHESVFILKIYLLSTT